MTRRSVDPTRRTKHIEALANDIFKYIIFGKHLSNAYDMEIIQLLLKSILVHHIHRKSEFKTSFDIQETISVNKDDFSLI